MAFTILTPEANQLLSLGIRYILLPEAAPPDLSLTTIPSLRLNLPAQPKVPQGFPQQRALQQRPLPQRPLPQGSPQQRPPQQRLPQQRALQESQRKEQYYPRAAQAPNYNKPTELLAPHKKEESPNKLRPFEEWHPDWRAYYKELRVPQNKAKLVIWTYFELDEDIKHQGSLYPQRRKTIQTLLEHPWLPPLLKPDLFLPMKLQGLSFDLSTFLAVLYRLKVRTLVCFGEKATELLTIPTSVTPLIFSQFNPLSFWIVPMKSLEELAIPTTLGLQLELLQTYSQQRNKRI